MFFDGDDCQGKADWIRHPGTKNMRGRRFDNKVRSWRCSSDDCTGPQSEGGCHENKDGTPKKAGARRWLNHRGEWEGSGNVTLEEPRRFGF